MRIPEEIVKEKFGDDLSGYLYVTPYDLITFYKETWNEAIKVAAESAVAYDTVPRCYSGNCVVDKESILKLKK